MNHIMKYAHELVESTTNIACELYKINYKVLIRANTGA